ncbi:ribonuclease H-like domain-containing protein, partial [Tanacetum coccineum]
DTTYWLDPIRRIEFESALMEVEINLTWSLGFVSVELAFVEARISLIKLEFSSCLFADSLMNFLKLIRQKSQSIRRIQWNWIREYVILDRELDTPYPVEVDTTVSTVVRTVSLICKFLTKGTENYQVWSCAMLLALEGKKKTIFLDGTCKRSNVDEVLGRQWDRFLMGLDDSYMHIISSILSRETLSDVRGAYSIIYSEESHRVVPGSSVSQRSQLYAFNSNVGNRSNA